MIDDSIISFLRNEPSACAADEDVGTINSLKADPLAAQASSDDFCEMY